MHNQGFASDWEESFSGFLDRIKQQTLTETETLKQTAFDAISLNGSRWVDQQVESLHFWTEVVVVAIAWDDARENALCHAVEHPSSCTTLRMTSQPFLSNDRTGVALGSSEMLKLLVEDGTLVFVICSS